MANLIKEPCFTAWAGEAGAGMRYGWVGVERLMLATERANGGALTMAGGEGAGKLIQANSSTHKFYIFNYFMMSCTILPPHSSRRKEQTLLFSLLFPLNAQAWEDIDLSWFQWKSHIIADGERSATATAKLNTRGLKVVTWSGPDICSVSSIKKGTWIF